MDNIISNKSFNFAVRIVNLYKYLCSDKKEFVLSKQLLRSGTSIGANVKEAINAQSRNDFLKWVCRNKENITFNCKENKK